MEQAHSVPRCLSNGNPGVRQPYPSAWFLKRGRGPERSGSGRNAQQPGALAGMGTGTVAAPLGEASTDGRALKLRDRQRSRQSPFGENPARKGGEYVRRVLARGSARARGTPRSGAEPSRSRWAASGQDPDRGRRPPGREGEVARDDDGCSHRRTRRLDVDREERRRRPTVSDGVRRSVHAKVRRDGRLPRTNSAEYVRQPSRNMPDLASRAEQIGSSGRGLEGPAVVAKAEPHRLVVRWVG
jgi:hypothetical protein